MTYYKSLGQIGLDISGFSSHDYISVRQLMMNADNIVKQKSGMVKVRYDSLRHDNSIDDDHFCTGIKVAEVAFNQMPLFYITSELAYIDDNIYLNIPLIYRNGTLWRIVWGRSSGVFSGHIEYDDAGKNRIIVIDEANHRNSVYFNVGSELLSMIEQYSDNVQYIDCHADVYGPERNFLQHNHIDTVTFFGYSKGSKRYPSMPSIYFTSRITDYGVPNFDVDYFSYYGIGCACMHKKGTTVTFSKKPNQGVAYKEIQKSTINMTENYWSGEKIVTEGSIILFTGSESNIYPQAGDKFHFYGFWPSSESNTFDSIVAQMNTFLIM